MKKGNKSNFSIKRINTSPYFSASFSQLEFDTIKKLTGIEILPSNSPSIVSALITNTHTDFSTISNEQLDACELLIHPNSGYDNFPREFIADAKFPMIIGNPIRAHAVTNYILSSLLAHYSSIPTQSAWSPTRSWPRKLLSELNIMILGIGHIGTLLKKSLAPLVREIRIYDPYAGFPDLDLRNIDVLIPACSLNKQNFHFINTELLQQLNENFLFINAARGALVKTEDLLSILAKRPDAYAILDVFEKEPADFQELQMKAHNLKLSSHIAGVYRNIDYSTAEFEAKVISDFLTLKQNEFEKIYKTMNLKNRLIENDFLI